MSSFPCVLTFDASSCWYTIDWSLHGDHMTTPLKTDSCWCHSYLALMSYYDVFLSSYPWRSSGFWEAFCFGYHFPSQPAHVPPFPLSLQFWFRPLSPLLWMLFQSLHPGTCKCSSEIPHPFISQVVKSHFQAHIIWPQFLQQLAK